MLDPIQVDGRIGVSTLATREVPPWRRMGCPRASMYGSGPDNERVKAPTIRRNAFNGVGSQVT